MTIHGPGQVAAPVFFEALSLSLLVLKSEKLGAVKLKIHFSPTRATAAAAAAVRHTAVVREKLAGIYLLVKDP